MAEKKVIELEVKTNAQSLKAQLREAQQEVQALSDKFGATSAQAINAAKRAAELKDAIGDAKALTDAFNPDAKFNALSSSIGGVVNGFQVGLKTHKQIYGNPYIQQLTVVYEWLK